MTTYYHTSFEYLHSSFRATTHSPAKNSDDVLNISNITNTHIRTLFAPILGINIITGITMENNRRIFIFYLLLGLFVLQLLVAYL